MGFTSGQFIGDSNHIYVLNKKMQFYTINPSFFLTWYTVGWIQDVSNMQEKISSYQKLGYSYDDIFGLYFKNRYLFWKKKNIFLNEEVQLQAEAFT